VISTFREFSKRRSYRQEQERTRVFSLLVCGDFLAFSEPKIRCKIAVDVERSGDVVFERLVFRVHAIQRMYQRSISEEEVRIVIKTGETIEDYPDHFPYPGRLASGGRVRDPSMLWWLTTQMIEKTS